MSAYILKRIFLFFPTLLGVITINFLIVQMVPGGPIEQKISAMRYQSGSEAQTKSDSKGNSSLSEEQINGLKKLYGFDKPLHVRYLNWVYKLFTFQFGDSYFHHKSVIALFKEKLPVSISLGVISFILLYSICIPLGIYKAVRENTIFDTLSSIVILIGYSIPGFVLGVFLILLFGGGSFFDVFPIRGLVSDNFDMLSTWGQIKDLANHLALPIICLTIGNFAVLTILVKNLFIDNIKKQYVMTARAKGISEPWIILKHVFRNAVIILISGFVSSVLGVLLAGSLLIETLFSLDGLGLLTFNSTIARDYPVVMAVAYFSSLLYVVGNLLSDVFTVIVDPRINFDELES